jgi:hypothetical protein
VAAARHHLLAYAEAVADHDTAAKQTARTGLAADDDAYASWLAQVRRSGTGRGNMVRVQNAQLRRQLDAYARRDYGQAYRTEREAYEHMFTAATTMATASMAPKVAASLGTPPQQLRSAFAMLLGENMVLVVGAQRATFAGSREFKAAAEQVNANTTAMTRGMAGIVGPTKAAEFQAGWAEHVEGLMAYTAAVADKMADRAACPAGLVASVCQPRASSRGAVRSRAATNGQPVHPLSSQICVAAGKRSAPGRALQGSGRRLVARWSDSRGAPLSQVSHLSRSDLASTAQCLDARPLLSTPSMTARRSRLIPNASPQPQLPSPPNETNAQFRGLLALVRVRGTAPYAVASHSITAARTTPAR